MTKSMLRRQSNVLITHGEITVISVCVSLLTTYETDFMLRDTASCSRSSNNTSRDGLLSEAWHGNKMLLLGYGSLRTLIMIMNILNLTWCISVCFSLRSDQMLL